VTVVSDDAQLGDVELFDPPPWRRAFAPSDVLRLVVGIALILGGVVIARLAQSTVEGVASDLAGVLARLPDQARSLVLSTAQLVTSLVPAIAFVVLVLRRRWKVALLLIVTGLLASLAMTAVDAIVINHSLSGALVDLQRAESARSETYPSSYVVAATMAVVTVAAPWVSRRWRRVMWWGVGLLVVLRLLAVTYPAFDLVLSLGVGTTVGALVLLVFGSPNDEPSGAELLAALRSVGMHPKRIARLPRSGSQLRYSVTDGDGSAYLVGLRTPDERDADLLDRAYRGLRFQATEVDVGYSTLKRRVEHEALVLTLAERAGLRVASVAHIGTTSHGSAFLVTRAAPSRPMTEDDLRDPEILRSVWTHLGLLHDAGLAHRRLTLQALRLDDTDEVWFTDFDSAQTAPSEREEARDVAELLTETALVVGVRDAVATAVAAIGPAVIAQSLRMLQPLALPPATRKRAKAVPRLLDQLRDEVNEATGAPEVELEHLERIRPRTVLIIGASALAFYTLLPQLTNLSGTIDSFRSANFAWIGAALLASIVTYVWAAISFQGAVADPVPFVPDLRLQVASSFTGLVGPGGAGGYALKGRFLQRVGVGGPEAAASVAVAAVAGLAVHITLLVGFILWSGQSGIGGFSLPDSETVLLVMAGLLAVVGVFLAIGPVRQRLLVPVVRGVKTGLGELSHVFRQPSRVAALFGGSAALTLTYVAAMACCIQAYGGGLTLAQIGAAYLAGVAIATLAPTPGGLGALESALIAGFTGFGLPDSAAISAVLTFRLLTFWLPVLPGWFALTWMQRNEEV
jgi:uncharacterized membrane protein YbhN (UPF0104 family)/tRNA A-37 threonylcarbamoyl transferase component Bud32